MKKGWIRTRLSDVAAVQSGAGFPDRYQGQADRQIPFYKVSDMNIAGNEQEMIYENNSITEEVRRELGAFLFPKGSTIFPKIGGAIATNKKRLTTRDCCVDNNVMGAIPRPGKIESDFLFYFFLAHDLSEFANEAHLPSIKKTVVEGWPITLPATLPEQQRIVGILDEAFEGITTAKANAEKNLQNARAIFESHLQSVFTRRGSSWPIIRLGNMVERLTNGYVGPTRGIYSDSGIPYLLARHVKSNNLTFDGKTFVSEAFNAKHRKSILKVGDVLLVQSGHIGHSAVVTPRHDGHNCHAMIVITPSNGKLDGKFLSWFFGSPLMQRRFERMRTGSTIKHLNCGDVIELEVPTPVLADQKRIVEEINSVHLETQRLGGLYARKLAALEALKSSLLHQAFTGQL